MLGCRSTIAWERVTPFPVSRPGCAPRATRGCTHGQGREESCEEDREESRKEVQAEAERGVHETGAPSAALAEVVGSKPIPRTEVTKRLWAYIKKNKLQDTKNKRTIKADAALKAVFGGKAAVNMFEMTKLVSKHLK